MTQNDDDGAEDPQYPWARDVTTTSAEYRYCEADAQGVCNSHTSEIVRWFSFPFSKVSQTPGALSIAAPDTFSFS